MDHLNTIHFHQLVIKYQASQWTRKSNLICTLKNSHRLHLRKGLVQKGNNSQNWVMSKVQWIRQRSRRVSYHRMYKRISNSTRPQSYKTPIAHGLTLPLFSSLTMLHSTLTNCQLSNLSCSKAVWTIHSKDLTKVPRRWRNFHPSQASGKRQRPDGAKLVDQHRRKLLVHRILDK